jgi:hypothetical protein
MDQLDRYPKIWVTAFLLAVEAYESARYEREDANKPDNL